MSDAPRKSGLPFFDLDEKDCRVIADGLSWLAAHEAGRASERRMRYIDQLGILFETYATPRKKAKNAHL